MIRATGFFFVLLGYACAQSSTPSAPMAATTVPLDSASSNPVTPDPTAPPNRTPPAGLPNVLLPPHGKTTLVGGTIGSIDHLRDRLVLEVYGGGRTTVLFDERTRVLRGDKVASVDDLQKGERVYVDTTLDGTAVFARTVRIADVPTGKSSGQIVAFDASSGKLTLRDALSPEQAELRIVANTLIQRGDHAGAVADLRPGTLVTLTFLPGRHGTPEISRISILASPGSAFVFAGRIKHLDLHRGLMVLVDPRDDQIYEISLDGPARHLTQDLRQGMDVTVHATFNGTRYQANEIAVNSGQGK